jgi:hypothetical protein
MLIKFDMRNFCPFVRLCVIEAYIRKGVNVQSNVELKYFQMKWRIKLVPSGGFRLNLVVEIVTKD